MNLNSKKYALRNFIRRFTISSSKSVQMSRYTSGKSYYEILHLKRDCSNKEIRDAFIHLAKKYHPDANQGDPESHAQFVELQKAYSVLSVPSKRTEYDLGLYGGDHFVKYRRTGPQTTHSNNPYNNFDNEFKEFYYRSRQTYRGPEPAKRFGAVKVTLFLIAFTTVGALVQYYILKWLYQRSFNEEMEKHYRGIASFQALKQEMDKRAEEYDIKKLRAAYFKEVGATGTVGLNLVPAIIRPEIPTPKNTKEKAVSVPDVNKSSASE